MKNWDEKSPPLYWYLRWSFYINYLGLNWLLLYHLAQGSSLDLQGDPYKCGIGRWRQDSWYYYKWLPAKDETSELGTLELETFYLDCLIRISNADTFNFLLNPLVFGYSTEKSKTGFLKFPPVSVLFIWAQNFKFPGFWYATLICKILYIQVQD